MLNNHQDIKKLFKKKNINLFDHELRIITTRINSTQNIYNIIKKNIFNNKNIKINTIKNEIFNNTNILLSSNEIYEICKNLLNKNNDHIGGNNNSDFLLNDNLNNDQIILNYLNIRSKQTNKKILNKINNQEYGNIIYNITL